MIKGIWVAVLAAFFIAGCTTTDPYRTSFGEFCEFERAPDCAEQVMNVSALDSVEEYRLSFIEYDDQGQLNVPEAQKIVTDAYREIAEESGILLMVFVHGWHHNANGEPEDANIASFREILRQASENEKRVRAITGKPRRKVLGVYIGWRGTSLNGFLNYFTFWARKATAHEVGDQGMTEVLLELEQIVKQNKAKHSQSRMITIGHSFGGAALFSSLHSVLSERYVSSRPYKTTQAAEGFGDLVVLLNPAFEAIRYGSLCDLSQDECREYPETQLPKLIILTSHADMFVRWFFPIGRLPGSLVESHRTTPAIYCPKNGIEHYELNQWDADIHAVGHFDSYLTHVLDARAGAKSSISNGGNIDPKKAWLSQIESERGSVVFNGSVLISKGRTRPNNPYMNIFTTKDVMSGHNDIWNEVVSSFLSDLIRISTAE